MSSVHEVWRPVVGYEGLYEVSNLGRVKRVAKGTKCPSGYIFAKSLTKKGYLTVGLLKNGARKGCVVHRLVLNAFRPPSDPSLQVNHKDGDKTNARLDNLEWVTGCENMRHAFKTKLIVRKRGSKHHNSKLTEAAVLDILNSKEDAASLAARYEITRTTVYALRNGKTWKHLTKKVAS